MWIVSNKENLSRMIHDTRFLATPISAFVNATRGIALWKRFRTSYHPGAPFTPRYKINSSLSVSWPLSAILFGHTLHRASKRKRGFVMNDVFMRLEGNAKKRGI